MKDWIFLSKNGQDPYINTFAAGCRSTPTNTEDFDYNDSTDPIVLRGILKDRIMKKCWKDARDFYYMDTGYFGNEIKSTNPNGWKYWHRITKNNLQLGDEIIPRPNDRWKRFNKSFKPWNKKGKNILLTIPDEKPCKFYGLDLEDWKNQTIAEIKTYTDRHVIVRERVKNREQRTVSDPLEKVLQTGDIFAVVAFNSNSAIEAIFQGIPAFVLAPCHAARPVCHHSVEYIESPQYADRDKLEEWARHLAYGQFHIDELKLGKAKLLLEEFYQ
jgi:hypothetical protein